MKRIESLGVGSKETGRNNNWTGGRVVEERVALWFNSWEPTKYCDLLQQAVFHFVQWQRASPAEVFTMPDTTYWTARPKNISPAHGMCQRATQVNWGGKKSPQNVLSIILTLRSGLLLSSKNVQAAMPRNLTTIKYVLPAAIALTNLYMLVHISSSWAFQTRFNCGFTL